MSTAFLSNTVNFGYSGYSYGDLSAYDKVTISYWLNLVYPQSASYPAYSSKDYDWTIGHDYETANGPRIQIGNVTFAYNWCVYGTAVPVIGVWRHILVTFDLAATFVDASSYIKFYLDGVLQTPSAMGSAAIAAGAKFNNTAMYFGGGVAYAGTCGAMLDDCTVMVGELPTMAEIQRIAFGELAIAVRPDLTWARPLMSGYGGMLEQEGLTFGGALLVDPGIWYTNNDGPAARGTPSPVAPTDFNAMQRAHAAFIPAAAGGTGFRSRIAGGFIQ